MYATALFINSFVFENLRGSNPRTYVDALGSIALAYGIEKIAGENGKEWGNQPNWSH